MSRLSTFVRDLASRNGGGPVVSTSRLHPIPPLVAEGFPIAVCWSAKSGCTTALKWFLYQNGLLEEARAHSDWVHDYRVQKLMAQQDYSALCARVLESTDTFVIKVVRDPSKRAVSSFLQFLRWHEHPLEGVPIDFPNWLTAHGKRLEDGVTFLQFLRFCLESKERGEAVDPHFQQQFDPAQDPRVDQYIPIERIGESMAALEKRFALPHSDIHALSCSSHHNSPSSRHRWPVQAAEFPATGETLAELGTPPAEIFLDRRTLSLIKRIFEDDFRNYGGIYNVPRHSFLRRVA